MHAYVSNASYKLAGLGILLLANLKYRVSGYTTPRTFSVADFATVVDYDIQVVDNWLKALGAYVGTAPNIRGKTALELGPGPDFGVGLYLLSMGASIYHAVDVHDLVHSTPRGLYDTLFSRLAAADPDGDTACLMDQLERALSGSGDRIRYVCDNRFRIDECVPPKSVDLVFSQAAFEHFSDVDDVARRVSIAAKPGAVLVTEIDLKTHSRWIRDVDPNNIYRFSDLTYRLLRFPGSPNRLRPRDYVSALQRNGWANVRVFPARVLPSEVVRDAAQYLSARYRSPDADMQVLTCVLCATKE